MYISSCKNTGYWVIWFSVVCGKTIFFKFWAEKIVFKMLVKEFYKIFLTEESTVKYLQDYDLLPCVK
jgi:hypothetical protein